MHIFGCKFSLRTDSGDTVPDRKNFDSLLWAIVTVFQVRHEVGGGVSGGSLAAWSHTVLDLKASTVTLVTYTLTYACQGLGCRWE